MFLWGGSESKRQCSLVNWDWVTCPKERGLEIRQLKEMDVAFMAKLGWQSTTENDNLWVWVLHT